MCCGKRCSGARSERGTDSGTTRNAMERQGDFSPVFWLSVPSPGGVWVFSLPKGGEKKIRNTAAGAQGNGRRCGEGWVSSENGTGMSAPPFAWLWGDPADTLGRLRVTRERMEKADKAMREQERRRKARKIRKLLKAAKSRKMKGQA